ncbi:TBC-domain-containing protein [Meira miltonrushii]|uniref:TBC-domain-containing protein n=1 Tax=Meira miltonrushii TaxID=1280837 RepID=A0A316V4N6_9BASI|nr:TBC-domain-containing protein [Meira miltonrushii]PWN32506.1 TBC-domain-containing protein [Meira miltonrushii]
MTSKAVDAVRKGGDAFGFASSVNDTTPTPNGESNGTGANKQASKRAKGEEEWSLGGLIGLGQLGSNPKDQQEFQRLIQGGIPLIYRPKLWYECSGAFDRVEPGRYQELLDEHENEENACTKQIDLDVGRTMPTNIFFAGDGPGVAKLRRLLVAYSWYNPQCGYCQGMNNLAATLLLTHATEEEAFWVLASLIENILPVDYFTAHLLIAQADQRVLIDFVQELMPKLAGHIDELGVDLPAVTFAWFLSLYTDCLPVETLFRVWDVLFVEGMGILFKVALSIFMLNEKELLRTNSPSSFYSLMHSMTSHQFSADKLLALACEGLRSSVKMDKIEERRAKHIQDLQIELGLDPTEIGHRTPSGSSIQM